MTTCGPTTVTVRDAFASVSIAPRAPWTVEPDDLIVCDGRIAEVELLSSPPGRIPRPARGAGPEPRPRLATADRDSPTVGHLVDAVLLERHRPARPLRSDDDDTAVPLGGAIAARAVLLGTVRQFFASRGFTEVETPAIVRSPGLDQHLDAFEVQGGLARATAFLITSPEYHMKRLLVAGVPRLFQISHCFRRGEVGQHHNPEFAMLEWYRAFAGHQELMEDTEQLVRAAVERIAGTVHLQHDGHPVRFDKPFARRTVAELFEEHAAEVTPDPSTLAREDEEQFFRTWIERIEPAIARSPVPLFVTRFPAAHASLARLCADDPRWCERFELYVAGLELCNGFGELTCPLEQRARLLADEQRRARDGRPAYPIDERFLGALERGMPPSGGNALGLDRLLMLCTGADAIAQVQSFPLDRL